MKFDLHMMARLAAALCGLGAALAAEAAPVASVEISEPPRVVLAVRQASGGGVAGLGLSELLRGFDEALAAQSSLRRLRWSEDWARTCLEQPSGLYRCVLALAAPADREPPAVVMILAFAEVDGAPRVGLRAFRVDEARAAPREAGGEGGDPWPVARARRRVDAGAQAAFASIFTKELAALLDAYPKRGRLQIRGPRAGARLIVDGVSVTTPVAEMVEVRGLEPGPHEVRLEHPELSPAQTSLQVESGGRHLWDPSQASLSGQRWRQGVLWTGVGLLATGAALAAGSVALKGEGLCSALPETECPKWRWARTGGEPNLLGHSGGVPLLPLGYSVAAVGATWLTGALLTDREDDVPWIAAAAGLVVGAVAFGVSMAVEPQVQ